ncbi:MAG: GNAT family N-acetyltransferase [Patescibacteria group bacterium]
MPVLTATPIRPLARMDIEAYADHLKKLDHEDRVLRFCQAVKDEAIDNVVGKIRDRMARGEDEVFAHFSPSGELLGAAHVSVGEDENGKSRIAEVGISVLPEGRGQGVAKALMERAILHAANRRCARLVTMCLVTNESMDKLAKSVGMRVRHDFEENLRHGELPLPEPTWHTVSLEAFLNQASVWDEAVDRTAQYGKNFAHAMFDRMAFVIPKIPGSEPDSDEERT